MARILIREAHSSETREISDRALPYFPGWVIIATLDDSNDAEPLYLSKVESDFRYTPRSEVGEVVAEAVAANATVAAAAAAAVSNAVATHDLIDGHDPRAPEIMAGTDWLYAVTDASDKVLLGVRPDGTVETFDPLRPEVLPYESDWLYVITDASDKILGGWRKDGTFDSLNGTTAAASTASTWPAVAYGDSTTFGADLTDPATQGWVPKLAALTGKTIDNRGSSGQRAEEIAVRQGGLLFTLSVTGNSIPASGGVVVTGLTIDPLRGGSITTLGVTVGGVAGTLSRSGTTYTFTRTAPGAAVTVPALVDAWAQEGSARFGSIQFIGAGINNEPLIQDGTQTVNQVCQWYAAMVESLTAARPRYVVWGMLDRGPSEGPGTPVGTMIAQVEDFLAKSYGSNYVPVRRYMASYRALAEAGIAPTADDDAAIAVGTVPPSLRYNASSVHLNAAGHTVMAAVLYRHITRKGWL